MLDFNFIHKTICNFLWKCVFFNCGFFRFWPWTRRRLKQSQGPPPPPPSSRGPMELWYQQVHLSSYCQAHRLSGVITWEDEVDGMPKYLSISIMQTIYLSSCKPFGSREDAGYVICLSNYLSICLSTLDKRSLNTPYYCLYCKLYLSSIYLSVNPLLVINPVEAKRPLGKSCYLSIYKSTYLVVNPLEAKGPLEKSC